MFYRPNFCCHCGEKIVRSRWTPLTSRRFCDFCEVEQKQHELLTRVAAAVVLLIGAAGLVGFFAGDRVTRSPSQLTSRTVAATPRADRGREPQGSTSSNQHSLLSSANGGNQNASSSQPALPKQLQGSRGSSTEPVYYCGAITKKGSPCTRRVKTKGPCWQHKGRSQFD